MSLAWSSRWVTLFVVFLLVVPAQAVARTFAPVSLKPGALNEVYAWDDQEFPVFQVELTRGSTVLALSSSLIWPHESPWKISVAFLAFDVLTKPGPARLRFLNAQGKELAKQEVEVTPRVLPVEHIALDRQMSTLRAVPDPRKDKEAQQIWRIYQTVNKTNLWATGRFELPVTGIPYSASFGDERVYDYSDGTTASDYHRGTDFAAPVGTPVYAPAAGLVVLAAERMLTGNTVVIEHAPGLYSDYFHLSKLEVKLGDRVKAGDLLGLSGKTGLVTGPHLHWELRYQGVPVDALDLVTEGLLDTERINTLISSIERKRG